jgi:hypothetical protein
VQFAVDGVPLIQECNRLACQTRTIVIWSITGVMLLVVCFCICWNNFIHWRAARATDVRSLLLLLSLCMSPQCMLSGCLHCLVAFQLFSSRACVNICPASSVPCAGVAMLRDL